MRIWANIVFLSHLFWVGLILGGGSFAATHTWYSPINFAVVATTAVSQVLFLGCPLTALEKALRSHGKDRIEGVKWSFTVHYLERWFGFTPPTIVRVTVGYLIGAFAIALFGMWLNQAL